MGNSMSKNQSKSDSFVDAVAAIILISILVITALFWVSGQ